MHWQLTGDGGGFNPLVPSCGSSWELVGGVVFFERVIMDGFQHLNMLSLLIPNYKMFWSCFTVDLGAIVIWQTQDMHWQLTSGGIFKPLVISFISTFKHMVNSVDFTSRIWHCTPLYSMQICCVKSKTKVCSNQGVERLPSMLDQYIPVYTSYKYYLGWSSIVQDNTLAPFTPYAS